MQGQDAQLGLHGMSGGARLLHRDAAGDDDIAEEAAGLGRERQHVGHLVLAAKLSIERPHAAVGDDGDTQIAARDRWSDSREPRREPSRFDFQAIGTCNTNA